MKDVVVTPAPGASFTLVDFVDFIDFMLLEAEVTDFNPNLITISTPSQFGFLEVDVFGFGFQYNPFLDEITGGTVQQLDTYINGELQGTIETNLSIVQLGLIIDLDETGQNRFAIEEFFMGLSWDYTSTDAPVIAPRGTTVGDGAIFNLRGDDIITLGAGDDDFYAGDGNDIVFGGAGDDILDGGAGDDELYGGPGDDFLIGGSGNDYLDGQEGANILYGGTGDNVMVVRDVDDWVIVDPGGFNTVINYSEVWVDWFAAADVVEIVADPDDIVTVIHLDNDGLLIGGAEASILYGFGGNMTYMAGDGLDILVLNRFLEGDTGAHTVIVEESAFGFSWDVVYGFELGTDTIDISDYGYDNLAEAMLYSYSDGAAGFYVFLGDLDRPDLLWFADVALNQIDSIDFIV